MRRECFNYSTLLLGTFLLVSCSRENTAPPAAPAPTVTTTARHPQQQQQQQRGGTYEEGMDWLRSAPAFTFALKENDIEAEGEVRRVTVGAERVLLRVDGEEWRATAGAEGVRWERRAPAAWNAAAAPPFGNRVYQRVTLAFDPQKKEGTPQLVESEADVNHYRFTNANTGETHDVWVSRTDGHLQRMTIGNNVDLRITPPAH